jgi:uncharacterized repeat protein (TIGR03803 family)
MWNVELRHSGDACKMTKLRTNFIWKKTCAALLLSAASTIVSPAQTFTTLASFCVRSHTCGIGPGYGPLVQGLDGNFYGTTEGGGVTQHGTVSKITTNGAITILHSFGQNTGTAPEGGLVLATNGNFYDTTELGGAKQYGTVFKITPDGTLTTLHSFNDADGANPSAGLVQVTDGALYGTTQAGGANRKGTVFKITPNGTFTTLYSFCSRTDCADGEDPLAPLVQASDGNLYGTTFQGGASVPGCGGFGCGTLFKITLNGTLTTLYSFCSQTNCIDGAFPYAGALIQATNANLYGTTFQGGQSGSGCRLGEAGCGTLFKITTSGMLTTLYNFCSQTNCTDGAIPFAGVVQTTDGNFYGTTSGGGANNQGTIFKITPSGTFSTLYNFCTQTNCTDGAIPYAALFQATNGSLYGTTHNGGTRSDGTVFELSVGLGPLTETLPGSGKVGAAIKILGTKLTGTTAVSFNGIAATFTVVSDTEITTTVPSGATTGFVTVTTPSGKLKSNKKFRVIS